MASASFRTLETTERALVPSWGEPWRNHFDVASLNIWIALATTIVLGITASAP